MMKYQRFDELPVWQEAARLYQRVLDLLEEPNVPLPPTFRGQLERTALAVSNQIADSRDRMTWKEATGYLGNARAAATEIQSMVAVISQRPKVSRLADPLQQIRALAESCSRQLGAWMSSVEKGPRQTDEAAPANSLPNRQPAAPGRSA
jgi:four helix bundle protein